MSAASGALEEATLSTPYTCGIWMVKRDRADEFVAAWTELAEWSAATVPGARGARLLRDRNNTDRFVSLGPWDSIDAIERWRSMEGWKERVGKIRQMLSGFEALTLELVVERSRAPV